MTEDITQVIGLCCPATANNSGVWRASVRAHSSPWSSANVYVSMGILCEWAVSEAELSRWAEHICIFITEHLQHTNLHAIITGEQRFYREGGADSMKKQTKTNKQTQITMILRTAGGREDCERER